jgi:hypothetical protein
VTESGFVNVHAASPPRDTVAGWKGIAAYFGRDERTVMRWAAERGLPVRRMPGQKRASVYAVRDELAAWLNAEPPPPGPSAGALPPETIAQASLPPTTPRRWRLTIAAAGLLVITGVGAAFFAAARLSPVAIPATAVNADAKPAPAAEGAYLQARYDLAQRTPASLSRAVKGFGAAIGADPRWAASYAGLAEAYLLSREYSNLPDAEAYQQARAADEAAVALDDNLAAAHRGLAFIAFWWTGDIPLARHEFARALALAPYDARTHHWFATALSANGEAAAALREIEIARRLDPNSTAILAGAGLLTYLAGNRAGALAMLRAVLADHPNESSSHQYLSGIAIDSGDDATFLAEAGRAAELRGDRAGMALVAAAHRGAAGGHAAMLRAIYQCLATERGQHGSWFPLAVIAGLQRNSPLALELLRRAQSTHDPAMMKINAQGAFAAMRADPGFISLARRQSLQP